jgi:hypothetical protein
MPVNKNICICPNPPGGSATCEERQLAICRIVDGQPVTECISPPSYIVRESMIAAVSKAERPTLLSAYRVANWTISRVLQVTRNALEPIGWVNIRFLSLGADDVERLRVSDLTLSPPDRDEWKMISSKFRFRSSGILAGGLRRFVNIAFEYFDYRAGQSPDYRRYPFVEQLEHWESMEISQVLPYPGPSTFNPNYLEEESSDFQPYCMVFRRDQRRWGWMLQGIGPNYPVLSPDEFENAQQALDQIRELFGNVRVQVAS